MEIVCINNGAWDMLKSQIEMLTSEVATLRSLHHNNAKDS